MLMMHSAVKTGSQEAADCDPDKVTAETFADFKTYE